jgi:hypothetical protein
MPMPRGLVALVGRSRKSGPGINAMIDIPTL